MAVDLKAPVMVVDDHAPTAGILKTLLTRLGFQEVEACSDAGVAYDKLQERRYALVVSDWNMSPMSGHDLLLRLRAQPDPRVPFVMISGEMSAERVVAARTGGADDFLVKPFDVATLKRRLAAVLGDF